ncbi:hypothetical protein Y032_0025g1271 [Ancylostoma ceylanicum]|uniref:Uncharacterized protein n=1 Tax=Ancylostoma ceylanicum TaxID=53326 RepID=A0A016UVM7_9BILA|nr:hypothetical protein Y032_0025g1271 [Ancylostoma ceylanicum]
MPARAAHLLNRIFNVQSVWDCQIGCRLKRASQACKSPPLPSILLFYIPLPHFSACCSAVVDEFERLSSFSVGLQH